MMDDGMCVADVIVLAVVDDVGLLWQRLADVG